MCGPIGAAVMTAGQLFQGYAGYQQGKTQAEAYKSQAAADEYNAQREMARARDASERGQIEAAEYMSEARQLKGAQRASASASGIDTNAGSAANVMTDSAISAAKDRDTILTNAQRERQAYEDNAVNLRNSRNANTAAAANARRQGRSSLFSGLLGATTTAIGADWSRAKGSPVAYDIYTRKPIYAGDKRL